LLEVRKVAGQQQRPSVLRGQRAGLESVPVPGVKLVSSVLFASSFCAAGHRSKKLEKSTDHDRAVGLHADRTCAIAAGEWRSKPLSSKPVANTRARVIARRSRRP
jgi:hypothetical protein